MERYIPTGNEMISLPTVNECDASIESLTFLSMQNKGLIEISGDGEEPLFSPFFESSGFGALSYKITEAKRIMYWIPHFSGTFNGGEFEMTVLTPVKERGFAISLNITAKETISLKYGIKGKWSATRHCINESKKLSGIPTANHSKWNDGMVLDYSAELPLFSLAPMTDKESETKYENRSSEVRYTVSRLDELKPGEKVTFTVFLGLGFEEVSAVTSAKEMLRRGFNYELDKTLTFLKNRTKVFSSEKLTEVYNTNLFFCMFYSTGITLDTEELICATSRSTRYYVSAAYWDRDTLLWAFPAILDADTSLAKRILEYVFTRQSRNFGVHSRFIDGVMLEPGFELDELVAPIIALAEYTRVSGDTKLSGERFVKDGIDRIIEELASVKDEKHNLYSTFLQPTDDETVYPYLTYDNVLTRRAFIDLAYLEGLNGGKKESEYLAISEKIKEAIYRYCVFKDENNKEFFAWSTDLNGKYDIYDEPPGSLQMLPYYGFCEKDDEVWQNTVKMIRSPEYELSFSGKPIAEIGCRHAPYPWVLSLCNSLLAGYEEQALKELEIIKMDNGIACESVDPVTGESTTGDAFATCAGFLCHSMSIACKNTASTV